MRLKVRLICIRMSLDVAFILIVCHSGKSIYTDYTRRIITYDLYYTPNMTSFVCFFSFSFLPPHIFETMDLYAFACLLWCFSSSMYWSLASLQLNEVNGVNVDFVIVAKVLNTSNVPP